MKIRGGKGKMDIKNYGFFIVDIQNKKIYVDLYLYYIVYSSNEKSTELHNNELKRDFEAISKNTYALLTCAGMLK